MKETVSVLTLWMLKYCFIREGIEFFVVRSNWRAHTLWNATTKSLVTG